MKLGKDKQMGMIVYNKGSWKSSGPPAFYLRVMIPSLFKGEETVLTWVKGGV